MTQTALRLKACVLPCNRVEFTAPELREGNDVELFVVLPEADAPAGNTTGKEYALDVIASLKGHRLFQTPEETAARRRSKGEIR